MKKPCFTFLFALLSFYLNAQTGDGFSRDSAEANRLLENARTLINNRRSVDAQEKVESAEALILRSVGKDSKEYGTYLHLKGTILINQRHYKESVPLFEEALAIRKKILGENDPETGKTANNLANAYNGIGDLLGAYEMHRQTLWIRERINPSNPIDIAISCTNLAGILNYRGEADSAIYYREKALKLLQETQSPWQKEYIALVHYNLGTDYYLQGDFQKAIDHTRQSISLRISMPRPNDHDIAFSYSGMANNYAGAGDFRSAVNYNLQALSISLASADRDSDFIAGTYSNLGSCYLSLSDLDSAFICHTKSLEFRNDPNNLEASFSYSNMGLVYMGREDFDSAIAIIQKSLAIRTEKLGRDHYLVIRNLNSLASCYALKKEYDQALQYLEEAQKANHFNGQNYDGVLAYSELIETLHDLGEISRYIYDDIHDINALKRSKSAFEQSRAVFDYRRNAFTQNGSEYAIKGDRIWEIDEKLIEVCYLLWSATHDQQYLSSAFEYTEKSKSWTLFESLQESKAIRFAGIDSSLLQKEYELRVDIGMLEKQIAEEEAKGNLEKTDHIDITKLNARLIKKRSDLNDLKKYLAENNGAYYRLKYGETVASLSDLQNRLQADQTVLEYFTGSFATYIFLIRNKEAQFVTCPSDSLALYVRQIRNCIDSSFDTQGMRLKSRYDRLAGQYAAAASVLYRKLVGCLDESAAITNRVIVIPDGILGYLPFELLLEKAPADPDSFNTHRYFALQHQISYNYSATLWREMSDTELAHFKREWLGIAPFTDKGNNSGLPLLRFSAEEVSGIGSRFKGNSLVGAKATVQTFRTLAPETRILHFSTHALVTGRKSIFNSSLAFFPAQGSPGEKTMLFIRDIYNIPLRADMVVLSACNAGIGELERGEGIISLARAFTYAGAKSIVTTLWSVNEASTKDLMIWFYNNLDKGDTKETALWKAQKQYLDQQKNSLTASHPYWWAGFIPIGNMNSLR